MAGVKSNFSEAVLVFNMSSEKEYNYQELFVIIRFLKIISYKSPKTNKITDEISGKA